MKCKICGHTSRTISAMRTHYWKKHEATMKKRISEGRSEGRSKRKARAKSGSKKAGYCPSCGKKL